MVSQGKLKTKSRRGLKILSPKQLIQRLQVALAQIKAGNIIKHLLIEIRQKIYFLYRAKEITE